MMQGHYSGVEASGIRRYVPLLVWAIIILVILTIPLTIISYGYLPPDDALRDTAQAVCGKPWSEILVLGNPYTLDHEFGWHALLRQSHLWTNCDAEGLVVCSVVALFTLVGWSALPWLKRPEAWLGVLILIALEPDIEGRFTMGRPLLLTLSLLIVILSIWHKYGSSPPRWPVGMWMTVMIAIAVFVHGAWYLWALPVAAFFMARQYRWGATLAAACVAGTVLGAAFTGHPVDYILGAVRFAFRSTGMHETQHVLVSELQPFGSELMAGGSIFFLALLAALWVMRQLAGLNARPLTSNPAFWLVCLGWALGFKARRFWEDWGCPALMVLLAFDLQLLLQTRLAAGSFKRLALTCGLAGTLYLAVTNDIDARWTSALRQDNLTWQYLRPDNPQLAGWFPEKGGIFYSASMDFFYQAFFKNPNGDWRYLLGFEPALMPDDDFAIFRRILWTSGDPMAYKPWVDKMRPQDRLVIVGGGPILPELEWNYSVKGVWIGRLPVTNAAPPTPMPLKTNAPP